MVETTATSGSEDQYRKLVTQFHDAIARKRAEFDHQMEQIRCGVAKEKETMEEPAPPVPVARRPRGRVKSVLSRARR